MKWIKFFIYLLIVLILFSGIYYFFFYSSSSFNSKTLTKEQKKINVKWDAYLERALMEGYLHHYDEAATQYRKLLEIRPEAFNVRLELALILYYQGKYQEALDQLQLIPPEKQDDKMNLLKGDIYLALNNYQQAEILYREHLQKFPEDREIKLKLAELLAWGKEYEKSIDIYQQILAVDPDNSQIRRQYALVLIWMGRHMEGAEELKKTLTKEKEIHVNKDREQIEENQIQN